MTSLFLSQENISTIWEVIRDEEIFKFLTRDIQENIFQMFSSNFKSFYESEKGKTFQLIDLNKKYILLILNYIKKNYPLKIPNKIKIFNEAPENELITYEEFQNERKTQFDKDLIQKQQEFENAINVKVPPIPEFSEKYDDKPISEMDILIKEITSKRNYDVEQLNYNNINQVNNWLKPQDTSIKSEKFNTNFFEDNNEITLNKNNSLQKNVTWGENKEISYKNDNSLIEEEVETNIFNKLKKFNNNDYTNINNHITHSMEGKERNEERLLLLEMEMKEINIKLNKIIDLIKDK